MKYVLLLSLAFLALTSASTLRAKVNLAQKAALQAKTSARAIDWMEPVPHKCQLITYSEANYQGIPFPLGTDDTITYPILSTEPAIKSFRLSHGCKVDTQDGDGVSLSFKGDVTNLEDFGWYDRMVQLVLSDDDKKCTVRLFQEQDKFGPSIDIYSKNPDLEATAAFNNHAKSYMIWDCEQYVVRAYPYKNYIGYLDLHEGNADTTFSTGISSIDMFLANNNTP